MERKVLFSLIEKMPMGMVEARQIEPFPEGLLIITTVSVRTQLYGRGFFESKKRNQWEDDWDYFPKPGFLVAQAFQTSVTVEVFHYGKEVRVVKIADELRRPVHKAGEAESIPLEPIHIGDRSITLSLAGKGESFKSHPVTLEWLEQLRESRNSERGGEELAELSLAEKRDWQRLAGLRKAGNMRGRFKKLCYFPKELIVSISDPAVR